MTDNLMTWGRRLALFSVDCLFVVAAMVLAIPFLLMLVTPLFLTL